MGRKAHGSCWRRVFFSPPAGTGRKQGVSGSEVTVLASLLMGGEWLLGLPCSGPQGMQCVSLTVTQCADLGNCPLCPAPLSLGAAIPRWEQRPLLSASVFQGQGLPCVGCSQEWRRVCQTENLLGYLLATCGGSSSLVLWQEIACGLTLGNETVTCATRVGSAVTQHHPEITVRTGGWVG